MRVTVKVIPKSKSNSVEEVSPSVLKVKTTSPAEKGKANESVISLVADYFKVKKSDVDIISGETSRQKVMEVEK